MFLTISTRGDAAHPATDLGYLLHKHPGKAQTFVPSRTGGALRHDRSVGLGACWPTRTSSAWMKAVWVPAS